MVAYRALRKGIMDFERRQVYRGPEAYVTLPAQAKDLDARVAEALQDHPDNDELKAAIALEANPKKVVAMLQSGETITVTGEGLKPVTSGLAVNGNPKTQIRRGAVIRLIRGAQGRLERHATARGRGRIRRARPAHRRDTRHGGRLRLCQEQLQPRHAGLAPAGFELQAVHLLGRLEKGFTPATVINDAPLFFDADVTGSQPWEPKNYDGNFDGPMSMRRGLAKSKNMVSIRVLEAIGPPFAQNWVTNFGFDADKHPAFLTMALGAGAVTPLQMATAYSVFANGGYRINPFLIAKLTDSRGRVLNEPQPAPLDESVRGIAARNAFVMTSLLQEVTRSGTAASASGKLKRSDIYGKTGTTNDSQDAWFAGWQRSVVAVVWMGYDTPRKLGDRETGGGLSLPIWIDYMSYALKGVPVAEAVAPSGVVNVGGEWYFGEYAQGAGISSLGLEEPAAAASAPTQESSSAPNEDERKGILDLFKR